jgi:hypothetical protein
MYEFASAFFIMEIFKTTLLPMSIYGFSTTVFGILFSTTVGSLVDTTPRLHGKIPQPHTRGVYLITEKKGPLHCPGSTLIIR